MLKTGFGGGAWVNEPSRWNIDGDQLTLATENETDFWRETYYGFVHDNGHAYLLRPMTASPPFCAFAPTIPPTSTKPA